MEILLFLSVLPSIILGSYIYNKDSIEKESKGLLFKCILGGVLAVIAVIVLSLILQVIFPVLENEDDFNLFQKALSCFIEIALMEEFFKFLFLKLFTWKDKEFSHLFDGIVYAVFVGIGFATLENLMYVLGNGTILLAILRALLSVPGHIFFATYMGYYYGQAKRSMLYGKTKEKNIFLLKSLLIPTLLHGFFDFCLTSDVVLLYIVYFIFIIVLYIVSFKRIIKSSKEDSILFYKQTFCSNCGCVVNSNFCTNCGTKKSN